MTLWNSAQAKRERALDVVLEQLLEAVMAGDRAGALRGLADAQARGVDAARREALAWVDVELVRASALPDDLDDEASIDVRPVARRG